MTKNLTFEPEPFLEVPDNFETLDSYEAEFDPYGEAETEDEEFLDSELGDDELYEAAGFRPQPVETPGGGRIQNKTAPNPSDIVTVTGYGRKIPLHRSAAEAWNALVTAARADGLAAPLLLPASGYRDPKRQKRLWENALKKYGSPEIARKWVAPPGGSAHQSGRAIDFYLGGKNSSGNVAKLRKSRAYLWLVANARRFGFYPYSAEPWHWEYNPPAAASGELPWTEEDEADWAASEADTFGESSETDGNGFLEMESFDEVDPDTLFTSEFEDQDSSAGSSGNLALPGGKQVVAKVPLLKPHRGPGPDLIISWNNITAASDTVDVIVHLHGYSLVRNNRLDMTKVFQRSGLNWFNPDGSNSAGGRTRPTLALMPRGHFFGGDTGRGYSFPALVTKTGLGALIELGMNFLSQRLGGRRMRLGRLIVTAHSGGGAALLRILQHNDPHEVHVFDGLYGDPSQLIRWAKARIARDQASVPSAPAANRHMPEQGGALRVLYRPCTGTQRYSLAVHGALTASIPPGSPLRSWYRVEETKVGHVPIPPKFGWRLLARANADLPEVSPPRTTSCRKSDARKEISDEFETSDLYEAEFDRIGEMEDETDGEFMDSELADVPESFETLDFLDSEMEGSPASTFPIEEFREYEVPASSSLRQRIVEVAKREWKNWDYGNKTETDPNVTKYLQEYFSVGVKSTVAASDLQNKNWHSNNPWSAVFISYVMRKAGAGASFGYARKHTTFIAAAKKAALAKDPSKFQAYDISVQRPEVGDLVCRTRAPKIGAPCAGTNFGNVHQGGISHSDIVVEVFPTYVVIIGGNSAQRHPTRGKGAHTVGQRKINLNDQGFVIPVQEKGACKYFAIVKPPNAGAAVPGGGITASGSQGRATAPRPSSTGTGCKDDRCTSAYIRWMQTSLNQILGKQLKPTGKLDSPTIGAIKEFKKSAQLKTKEYYAGSVIERTLIAAGAAPPPPLAKAPCGASLVSELLPLLKKNRGDIPIEFLLGWIEVESGRHLGSLTTICERGYFQLHPGESIKLGLDHDLMGTNAEYSVVGGIAMVKHYRQRIDKLSLTFGITRGSDVYWRLVKLCHWIPSAAEKILTNMRRHGIAVTDWNSISTFAKDHSSSLKTIIKLDPVDGVRSVDKTFKAVENWRKKLSLTSP